MSEAAAPGLAPELSPEAVEALLDQELPATRWERLDQPRISAFGELTGDHAPVHVDPASPEAAAFGGTIAQGFLTLSLLTSMVYQTVPGIAGMTGLNYGFDRVRFIAPVPEGARVRGQFRLREVTRPASGQLQLRWQVEMEIEGHTRPALVAEWLARYVPATGI
ncbi:MaoC family dehydratase [Aquicoccus sp. SCR17]|nr:MaoC family dehydratase [Carideicomes alvinocaridis]